MLSNLSKIWERVVKAKLTSFCVRRNLIPGNQFGFMRARSAVHSLMLFGDKITKGLNKGEPSLAVSLDIMKVFDSVDASLLVAKLMKFGVEKHLCKIVLNYLLGRRFRVPIGDDVSEWKRARAGVPQGSVLAPTLFIMFISDIPTTPAGVEIFSFADDQLVVANDKEVASGQREMIIVI